MKKNSIIIFILLVSLQAFAQKQVSVKLKWSSDRIFSTPESVIYNPEENLIYVANIQGKSSEKDGKGFISKLNMDGTLHTLHWVTGIDAPKGMGIKDNSLFVSNIDEVIEINIEKGEIVQRFPAKGAVFLNDVAIDDNGIVYISDTRTDRIYSISDEKIQLWLEDEQLSSANGLFSEENTLYVGSDSKIVAVDTKTKKIKPYIENTGRIDGLEKVDDGNYIISDWSGHVQYVSVNDDPVTLFDKSDSKVNAADINYVPDMKLLLVPTFFDNRVTCYELKE